MLNGRFQIGFVLRFFSDHHSLPPASLATLPSPTPRPDSKWLLFGQSSVILATLRIVELSPDLIAWLFRMTCATLRSSRLVSASQSKADTHRAPLFHLSGARLCFQYRIIKDHPHSPDILSVRQNRPTLARVSGTWSLLDGASAIAMGSFRRNRTPSVSRSTAFHRVLHAPALLLDPLLP